MDTHICPGCDTNFIPTTERPATPIKVWREHGRYFTAAPELFCPECVARLRSRGSWQLPSGGTIANWPSRDAKMNTSSCGGCGAIISLPEDSRRKLAYCSEPCRQVIYRRRNAKPNTSSCMQCGEEFTARRGAKYCSPKCRQAAYRDRTTA